MTLGDNLLRFRKSQKYLIYDKETEGLNKGFSRPWQLSFITFTLDNILEKHDYYIWWEDLNICKGAAEKTRFDYKIYKEKAQDARKVFDIFQGYRANPEYIILGHNTLGYDSMIGQVWARALGIPVDYTDTLRYLDTSALAKAFEKGIKPDHENLLAWQYKMLAMREGVKWSLGYLAKKFKIPYDEHRLHEAMYDIELNIEIFKKLVWTFEI